MPKYNSHVLAGLKSARDDLAVGEGDVRSRLRRIYIDHLVHLKKSDFPTDLQSDWCWIEKKLTEKGPIAGVRSAVDNSLCHMRNATGSKIAKKIVCLIEELDEKEE